MLKWVEPFMWAYIRVIAFWLQLVGCIGLIGFMVVGLDNAMNKLVEE